jgi:hypothetical protein
VGVAIAAGTIVLDGIHLWDVFAAVTALPLVAVAASAGVAHAYHRRSTDPTIKARIVATATVLGAVIAGGTALTFVSPVDGGAIYLFVGLSMIVAAVRGDPGCEVLSISNAILRRHDAIWCPVFAPFDRRSA